MLYAIRKTQNAIRDTKNLKLKNDNALRLASCVTRHAHSGIASLPLILLLGAIIIEVSIASVFFLSYLNSSVYGTRMANEALLAAQSGVNDAVLRITLYNDIDLSGDFAYSITTGNATANITLCKGGNPNPSCPSISSSQHQITAVGRALTRQHRLVGILTVDSLGLVHIDSIKDQ